MLSVNCLSGIAFNDAEIIDDPSNNVQMDIIDDTLATVTSDFGGNIDIPELNLELFHSVEIQVIFLKVYSLKIFYKLTYLYKVS